MNSSSGREALKAGLDASTEELLDASTRFLRADGGRFYMADFLVIGAAKRALSLSTAIFKLLDESALEVQTDAPKQDGVKAGPSDEAVSLENVTFAYKPASPVLRDVPIWRTQTGMDTAMIFSSSSP